ncbi:MAG: hypothetical protein AABZ39_19800 [Spirochaetota bacterium]
MKRVPDKYKVLFNHDSTCVFNTATPYQDVKKPVGLAQVEGYVDEVADAGCDVLLLSPIWGQGVVLWDSDQAPLWREKGKTLECPDTFQGRTIRRIRDFLLAGNDFIGITQKRAKEKGLAFFLTWRMNDVHGIDHPEDPWTSDFYRDHPEYRIKTPDDPAWQWNAAHAFDFSRPEVHAYQLGFIRELITRYDFDGIELDFMRHPYLFPHTVPFEERCAHLSSFVTEVRRLLDTRGKNLPICVRVPMSWDYGLEIGIDLKSWVNEGLVDMVNVSTFFVTSSEMEVSLYRQHLPKAKIYAELTQCTERGKTIELGLEFTRKTTPEVLRSTAQCYLAQGADGISLFNFVYYRDYSFGDPTKPDKFEPPFDALKGIADPAVLSREAKHYALSSQLGGTLFLGQMPFDLVQQPGPRRHRLGIQVGDDISRPEVRAPYLPKGVLRLKFMEPVSDLEVLVWRQGRKLKPCRINGELFPHPYLEGVPTDHAYYLDYEVPLELLAQGLNHFTVHLFKGKAAVVTRMEIALYRKDGYQPTYAQ